MHNHLMLFTSLHITATKSSKQLQNVLQFSVDFSEAMGYGISTVKRSVKPSPSGSRIPTLSDIARAASVSLPTASLALNNHPRVSSRTKLRVMEVASQLGYVPNQAARRLVRSRLTRQSDPFDQVAFLFLDQQRGPDLDGLNLSVMRGVEHELSNLGTAMVFLRVGDESANAKVTRFSQAGGIDGWLLLGFVNDAALKLVRAPHAPCVVLGGHSCKLPVHSVDINFREVGAMAARHLASLGHHRVAFIGGSMRHPYQREVLDQYRSTAREVGLDMDEQLISTHEGKPIVLMRERLGHLLQIRPLPTALFTAEVNYAPMVIDLLRQMELQVPGDISVLGCDIDVTPRSGPHISRIEFPFAEVGRVGASMLRELADKASATPRQVQITPILVEGWSCIPLARMGQQASAVVQIPETES